MAVTEEHVVEHHHEGSSMNWLIGLILLAVVLFLLYYYGLPALRSGSGGQSSGTTVPSQIDVNVNKPQ
jgi:hypothetical protein